jgi:hypothetical protein
VKRFLRLLVFSALSGAWITPASALPCLPGTLSDYVALGAGGCSIGSTAFADFAVEPFPGFAVDLDPGTILLTPITGGFALSADEAVVAGPGDFFGLRFLFHVEDPDGLDGGTIRLGESRVEPDGVNTAVLDAGAFGTAIAFDVGDGLPELVASFDGFSTFFDVFVEFGIDAGIGGTASLGPDLGSVTFDVPVGVPEPPALLLWVLGLIALKRRIRS